MTPFVRERPLVLWGTLLVLLSGCGQKVECDSPETRLAVLQSVSDNHSNPLATYAAKNSNEAEEVARSPNSEGAKPLYRIGDTIVTTSTSEDKRTLQCSGAISATVGDTKASKEINFTVQRSSNGKISVSVVPFQF